MSELQAILQARRLRSGDSSVASINDTGKNDHDNDSNEGDKQRIRTLSLSPPRSPEQQRQQHWSSTISNHDQDSVEISPSRLDRNSLPPPMPLDSSRELAPRLTATQPMRATQFGAARERFHQPTPRNAVVVPAAASVALAPSRPPPQSQQQRQQTHQYDKKKDGNHVSNDASQPPPRSSHDNPQTFSQPRNELQKKLRERRLRAAKETFNKHHQHLYGGQKSSHDEGKSVEAVSNHGSSSQQQQQRLLGVQSSTATKSIAIS